MLTIDALKADTASPVIIVDHEGMVVHINHIFETTKLEDWETKATKKS